MLDHQLAELQSDIAAIRNRDYNDSFPNTLARELLTALDAAHNCIFRLRDEVEVLRQRIRKLELSR